MQYIIKIKEVGNQHVIQTSYSGQEVTEEYLIEFFGLKNPDVEWYKIEKL
ncbi:MAG: hypothetical protein K2M17_02825 [Bacilli bacterium]|nr:hypothetical protein [Bacilli bacterium]